MNKALRVMLLGVAFSTSGAVTLQAQATAAAGPMKIGYVNSAAVLAQAPGRAEAEATFRSEVTSYEAQLQRMSDSMQTMAQSFEREAARLDSATRVARANTLRTRETEYERRARDLNQQMQRRQADLVRPIMENLQRIIEQVRVEDGYAMILDVGSQSSIIVAADKRFDITEKVIARVKAAPAPRPAAAAPRPGTSATTPQPAGVRR